MNDMMDTRTAGTGLAERVCNEFRQDRRELGPAKAADKSFVAQSLTKPSNTLSQSTAITYTTARWASGHANALTLTTIQLPALATAIITAQLGAIAAISTIHDSRLFAFFKNRQ